MMESLVSTTPEPKTEEESMARLDWLFKEMQRHEDQMNRNRPEIERLKAEADTIAAHTDLTLASLKRQIEQLQKASHA